MSALNDPGFKPEICAPEARALTTRSSGAVKLTLHEL